MIPSPIDTSYRLWIDTGGTFTDCFGLDAGSEPVRTKVLSSGCLRARVLEAATRQRLLLECDWDLPDDFLTGCAIRILGCEDLQSRVHSSRRGGSLLQLGLPLARLPAPGAVCEVVSGLEAPLLAAHWVTRTPLNQCLPPLALRLATTRGTNALLERRGSPTALFITRGFADLLQIGTQQRDELFSLRITRPAPLYASVIEVPERVSSQGEIIQGIDIESLEQPVREMIASDVRCAAVALLHSYRNPANERRLAEWLRQRGFTHVSVSSDLAPLIKILPRANTAVVNAYLAGVIEDYLEAISRALGERAFHLLTSSGGLVRREEFRPADSLLSGPAGGVIGAAMAAVNAGYEHSLAFDMGGTSTDVSRYGGKFDYEFETRVGDAHLMTPCLAIETVAAGGGSICRFDGQQLRVGPDSAGADPGPASYGAGGPLTLTDVNLLLGRLDASAFAIPIDLDAARKRALEIEHSVRRAGAVRLAPEALLQGFLDIANERMAEAIRRISIRRGFDPRDHALVSFGGAGGQHACRLAEILGIDTVLIPQDSGLLSAVGLGSARIERVGQRQVLRRLDDIRGVLDGVVRDLEEATLGEIQNECLVETPMSVLRRLVLLRQFGQESTLIIDYRGVEDLDRDFRTAYSKMFGYLPESVEIEVESIRIVVGGAGSVARGQRAAASAGSATGSGERLVWLEDGWRSAKIYWRHELPQERALDTPCLFFDEHSASLIPASWSATLHQSGTLVVKRREEEDGR